ncbi:MAG TPA: hypothetical protein VMG12_09345 [Polyangiaceae bacterium]|nr:hypothetical protein [Polyangiaceae bacterium]
MTTLTQILFGTSLLAASLLPPSPARADMLEGLGRWSGSGSSLSLAGKPQGDFRVELTRSSVGADSVETRGTVTPSQGPSIPFRSVVTRTTQGFTVESERGKGYATCVGPAVCHSYEVDADGNGSSTTILLDSPGQLRILVTVLEKGKPARLLWQTLTQQTSTQTSKQP